MPTQQIALITGANRGLGRNTALNLAKDGVDVLITYRNNVEEANAVVAEIAALGRTAVALQLDTEQKGSFDAFAEHVAFTLEERFGRDGFDLLVNNAGGSLHAAFAETTEEEFDTIMDVHVKGVFFLTQRLIGLLANGGMIINVSSGLTRFSFPGSSAYAMAKGAVEVLTRYLARELAERGITVNTLAPGAIATDFSGGMVRDNPETNKTVASFTALGRVGEAEDIGTAIAGLFSSRSRWITGQRIEASGGMLL